MSSKNINHLKIKNMVDLNELIKRKAENKLKADIDTFINNFRDHPFFKVLEELAVKIESEKPETFRIFFWNGDYKAGKLIKEKFLAEYVYAESKNFMDKVESFDKELQELKNYDYSDVKEE